MFVNGKKITEGLQEELRRELAQCDRQLELAIFQVGDDPVSRRYVNTKKKFGESLGIGVEMYTFPETVQVEEITEAIGALSQILEGFFSGVIVQLPLPKTIDIEAVLNTIPIEHDADLLSEAARESYENGTSLILPPVVGAIQEVFTLHGVQVVEKKIAIVGHGRLVGKPVATWLEQAQAQVTILTQADPLEDTLGDADIVISGTGVANLIQPQMLKDDVVLIDVGTSDEGGELMGDIDLRCAVKASLFAPVPGGIGPITMAMLFKNLITLGKHH